MPRLRSGACFRFVLCRPSRPPKRLRDLISDALPRPAPHSHSDGPTRSERTRSAGGPAGSSHPGLPMARGAMGEASPFDWRRPRRPGLRSSSPLSAREFNGIFAGTVPEEPSRSPEIHKNLTMSVRRIGLLASGELRVSTEPNTDAAQCSRLNATPAPPLSGRQRRRLSPQWRGLFSVPAE